MGSAFKFFLMTYLVTWGCWIPLVTTQGTALPSVIRLSLGALGTFAPAIVALALTAHSSGKSGLRELLSRLLQWNVAPRWYVFAILYMPVIKAAVALSHRFAAGTWPIFGHEGPVVIAVAILLSTPVQAGEEIG